MSQFVNLQPEALEGQIAKNRGKQMKDLDTTSGSSSKLMHWGMMACCAVMLVPVAGFFLAGGTITGLWSNLGVLAPVILCLAAHGLMFLVMGKSCHSSSETKNAANQDATFEDGDPVYINNK